MAGETTAAAAAEQGIRSSHLQSCFQKVKHRLFEISHIVLLLIGLILRLVDIGTDLWLAVNCFVNGHHRWGGLTLVFALVPTYLMQVWSLYKLDKENKMNTVTSWLMHIMGLGVEYRYMVALKTALTGTSEQLEEKTLLLIDLNAVNSGLESAPQLMLQLYISIKLEDITLIRGITMLSSLLSIAWNFGVSARLDGEGNSPHPWGEVWAEVLVVTVWLTASLTARMVAFIALALTSAVWFWILFGLHWLAMTAWAHHYDPDDNFEDATGRGKLCYSSIFGLVYSLHYGFSDRGPVQYWTRYTILLLGNLGCVSAYVMWRDHPTTEPAWNQIALILALLVALASALDLLFATVYLYFFKPNGREYLPCLAACASCLEDVSVPSLLCHGGRHSERRDGENSSLILPPITAPNSGGDPQVEQQQASPSPLIVRVNLTTVNPVFRVTSPDSQEQDLSTPTAPTSVDDPQVEQQQTSPSPPIVRVTAKITTINPVFPSVVTS